LRDRTFDRAWVPGSGAGRLAYDLHQNFSISETLAFDQNPLLTLAGHRASQGHELKWAEFPLNPIDLESASVVETFKAPAPSRDGLAFVLGDVLAPPFQEQTFDLTLTSWLIDVIPETFERFALRMNSRLKPGAEWINLGPLAFSHENPRFRYSFEEVVEILEGSGFKVLAADRKLQTPYLRSPHQSGSRIETLFWFHAKKVTHHPAPAPNRRLPEWIDQSSLAIPRLAEFARLEHSSGIFGTVCSLIDGKRNLNEISAEISKKFGLPPEAAILALRKFLSDHLGKSGTSA
jgi:hypothetical protein